MSDQTRELIEFNKTIEHFHIIRSNEFPDLDLYMDQVLAYLSRQLSVFKIDPEDNIITSSMINNYVKFGIVPPPEGKKYNRRHLAYIYAVCFLKQVLRLDEIKQLVDTLLEGKNEKQVYNYFCDEQEKALRACCLVGEPVEEISLDGDYTDLALKYAATSIASKLYAQKILSFQRGEPREKKKPERKKLNPLPAGGKGFLLCQTPRIVRRFKTGFADAQKRGAGRGKREKRASLTKKKERSNRGRATCERGALTGNK